MLKVKRVTETPTAEDGIRVLVEEELPPDLNIADAAVDVWVREVAPSGELRRWYGEHPADWPAFAMKYGQELRVKASVVKRLKRMAEACRNVTLLHDERNATRSHVRVLYDLIRDWRSN